MRKPVIKVENEKSQNPSSILRTFTKRVQSAGTLKYARTLRYHTRSQSDLSRKKSALKRLEKRIAIGKLIKLGKPLPERKGRRR